MVLLDKECPIKMIIHVDDHQVDDRRVDDHQVDDRLVVVPVVLPKFTKRIYGNVFMTDCT